MFLFVVVNTLMLILRYTHVTVNLAKTKARVHTHTQYTNQGSKYHSFAHLYFY